MSEKPLSYEEERRQKEEAEIARFAKKTAHHKLTDRLPVQTNGDQIPMNWRRMLHGSRGRASTVPRVVAEAAWEGYDADGHGQSQSSLVLHQRGGFGLAEIGYYLTRAIDEGRVEIRIVKP